MLEIIGKPKYSEGSLCKHRITAEYLRVVDRERGWCDLCGHLKSEHIHSIYFEAATKEACAEALDRFIAKAESDDKPIVSDNTSVGRKPDPAVQRRRQSVVELTNQGKGPTEIAKILGEKREKINTDLVKLRKEGLV